MAMDQSDCLILCKYIIILLTTEMRCNSQVQYACCFCSATGILLCNTAIRKNIPKERSKMIRDCEGNIVLDKEICHFHLGTDNLCVNHIVVDTDREF